MKFKKTVRVQIFAAIFMAFMGACVCAFSRSYSSPYSQTQEASAIKNIVQAEAETEEASLESPLETTAEEEAPAPFVPSLSAFNLAFLYGEGDQQEKSLGTEAAEALSLKDSKWMASIYQLADESPEQVALSLGMPAGPYRGLSFHQVRIEFYDEKGKQIAPRSNIQEIMSMANTYFYYAGPEDSDAFLSYAFKLWDSSHSFQYSLSEVYGDSPQPATPSQAEAGDVSETISESSDSLESLNQTFAEANVSPETNASLETISSLEDSGEIGPGIALKKASEAEAVTEAQPETEESLPSEPSRYIVLHVRAVITGLSDSGKGLFALDSLGNERKEDIGWQGWTEENKAYASDLAKQDWAELYGLTLSPCLGASSLSYDEIGSYMNRLPQGISEERKMLIRYALSSVGRVPYYWGGKPSSPGYENNFFGVLTEPDNKGRSIKGLDCSGWISWIYWSALDRRLNYESTDGLVSCGTAVEKSSLQPGDIMIKAGGEAHAAVFLGWEDDKTMMIIHESSTLSGNVIISTAKGDWTHYRKLID